MQICRHQFFLWDDKTKLCMCWVLCTQVGLSWSHWMPQWWGLFTAAKSGTLIHASSWTCSNRTEVRGEEDVSVICSHKRNDVSVKICPSLHQNHLSEITQNNTSNHCASLMFSSRQKCPYVTIPLAVGNWIYRAIQNELIQNCKKC